MAIREIKSRIHGPRTEIAISPEKSEISLLILVKIPSDSNSSSKGPSTPTSDGPFSQLTWLFEVMFFLGQSEEFSGPHCRRSPAARYTAEKAGPPLSFLLGLTSFEFTHPVEYTPQHTPDHYLSF